MSKSTVERPVDRSEQTIAGTLRRHGRNIVANWIRELALFPVIVLLLVVGAFVSRISMPRWYASSASSGVRE